MDHVVRQVAANAVATGMTEPTSPKSGRTSLGGEELIAALETGSSPAPWAVDVPDGAGGGGGGAAGPAGDFRSRARGGGPPAPGAPDGAAVAGLSSTAAGQPPLLGRDGTASAPVPGVPAPLAGLPAPSTTPGGRGAGSPSVPVAPLRFSPGVRAAWAVPSGAMGGYPPVQDVREDLCLAGFLPVAMRLCDRRRPAAVRLRAAQLLDIVLELPSTLQMLVACRGFTVYVEVLSDGVDCGDDDRGGGAGAPAAVAAAAAALPLSRRQQHLRSIRWELWELALRGIDRMLNMESGRYKRDFCRRFAWCGLLEPIAAALLLTGRGDGRGPPAAPEAAPDEDGTPSPYEQRIVALARLLQSFAARADSVVKARMATARVLEPMIVALQRGTGGGAYPPARANGWAGGDTRGAASASRLGVAREEPSPPPSHSRVDGAPLSPLLAPFTVGGPEAQADCGAPAGAPVTPAVPADTPQPSLPTAAREALFNCLRDLSRDPLTHEALTAAGALRTLVGELGRPSTSVELARCVVSSVCDLCMVSAERQEAAAVAGLVPHLEVAIRSNDVNLSAVCISIYSGLGLAGPRSRAALSAATGVATYTQLLASPTTLARWQARILSSLAEWLDVDAGHVEPRLASPEAVNHLVVCMARLQLRHAQAMLEPYRALVCSSRVVNKALGGRRTLIRLLCQWLSPPGWAPPPPAQVPTSATPGGEAGGVAASRRTSSSVTLGEGLDWSGGGGPRVRLLLLRILLAHAREWTPDTVAFVYAQRELRLEEMAAAIAADDGAIPVREQALLLSGQLDALRGCK